MSEKEILASKIFRRQRKRKEKSDNVAMPINEQEQQAAENIDTPQDTQNEPASNFMNDPDVMSYIEKAVQKGIQDALKGTPPKANTVDPTEQDKKKFDKMTYKERLNLFKTNPQKYYQLSKGDK